jgi:hypothetical protein
MDPKAMARETGAEQRCGGTPCCEHDDTVKDTLGLFPMRGVGYEILMITILDCIHLPKLNLQTVVTLSDGAAFHN